MKLFQETQLGNLKLANRVVMAPMTRSRAIGNLANGLMAEYYGARASAGLLITEGVAPSPNGLGYARIPGLFSREQAESWKQVAAAVHANGGKIFAQIMHTGRASHPANMPHGTRILAPSQIGLRGEIWTDTQGMQPYPVPEIMSEADIKTAVREFATAAAHAVEAGLDGIELHAANGYLLDQFLNPISNQRTDGYGGDDFRRKRFVLEVAEATAKAIGADRVGIRVSPYGVFNDLGAFEGIDSFYGGLASDLSAMGLAYIHVVDHSGMGAPPVSPEVKALIRKNFKGPYILSGNYNAETAEKDLQAGLGDLVAFGRPFLANPDLVTRLKEGRELRKADMTKAYTPGPEGYTLLD